LYCKVYPTAPLNQLDMQLLKDVLRQWLPIAAVTTAFCALVYVAVQQTLRHGANDPQIQLAEDAAMALERGDAVSTVLPPATVDLAQSLAPFLTIYDETEAVQASSGTLHGKALRPPAGVFQFVRQHGQERVTWQPAPGVRMAAVVVHLAGARPGFVLAARSLREVEKREAQVASEAGIAWLLVLVMSLILIILGNVILSRDASVRRTHLAPG
jgi:hypothetical protein